MVKALLGIIPQKLSFILCAGTSGISLVTGAPCTFLWLLFILGDLIKNASRLVGCLTLLKEGNHSEWVSRYHLVQVGELVLVHLRLCEEDLFTLLLRRGYFHCLTEVATLEVAEKLYLMPHELVHWHESGLLSHTKPANQLVAYI